ncbi:MAG: T9SS C-terminal target domain-containing protein [Ignavibacteriae bacterium]|nr:MAG: T9SS C-terminal target domain-containing protein [Ignavibacteriota bacterium]
MPDPLSYNTTYYWRVASLYEDDCTMDDYGPFSEPFSFTTRPGDGDYLNSVIVPNQFTLKQNYPNPFNPTTTIGYNIPFNNFVTLIVYDVNGKIVQTLVRMD